MICCPWQERVAGIGDLIRVYSGKKGRTIVFTNTKKEANEIAVSPLISVECKVRRRKCCYRRCQLCSCSCLLLFFTYALLCSPLLCSALFCSALLCSAPFHLGHIAISST